MKKTLFSAAKPTGRLTLGNYLGAVENWTMMQEEYNSIFCVADLHSLTVPIKPEELKDNSYAVMANYLACGIDPKKSVLFYQSHVKEHAELGWLLNCVTHFGEANRMVAFKEKVQQKKEVTVGLFDYPILMAADILLYDAEVVPIGEDQRQHLELARTLAQRFNFTYGETFKMPEGFYPKIGAKIYDLQNPTKKMSKSDEDTSGTILLEDNPDVIMKKIKRAVTDSEMKIVASKEKPGVTNLLTIYSKLTNQTIKEAEQHFEGANYGKLKTETAEVVIETLKPVQEKFNYYMNNKDVLAEIAKQGAEKAAEYASKKVEEVKEKMGLIKAI
ncbi:MAG: tryptophan--tRNA ligase [Clostridia bacterium]|nr:tryptophan--tRNA ligase [Clostridia bacterium]